MDYDVVIVGAGLSGLHAAERLVGAGLTVKVVEARERVGGRTLTRRVRGQAFDLGAQWIGGGQHRMVALAERLGCATFPTWHQGHTVLDIGGRRSTYKGEIPKLNPLALMEMHRALKGLNTSMALATIDRPGQGWQAPGLDAMSVADYRRSHIRSPSVRAVLDTAVRVVFGAEPSELSMLYFLYYLRTGGGLLNLTGVAGAAQENRFVDGAQTLSIKMAEGLGDVVQLESPVRRIAQDDAGVTVHTDRGPVRGRRCIVALAPALAGRIDYEPMLPVMRDHLTQRFAMGATTKAMLFYDEPFWRLTGHSGEAVSDGEPISAVFDNSGPTGGPWCLVAFVVGAHARRWANRPVAERKAAIVKQMVRLFGPPAAEPVDYVEQVWSTERWSLGCPTGGLPPGGMTPFGEALRRRCGRIHWAGTETARAFCGYMEGALEAAERAAFEVIDAVG